MAASLNAGTAQTSPHRRRGVNGTHTRLPGAKREPYHRPLAPRETSPMPSLRTLLPQPPSVVAPGCYDALSALMIERAGFPAAYFSGASLAYTRFGRPDIGLIAADEVVDAVAGVRERVEVPLIVDCDTGFGNALNVMRTVKAMARAGATAIQLEEHTTPKRCGHLADKGLIDAHEMTGKLKAALDARPSEEVLIIARTDAIAVEGFAAS